MNRKRFIILAASSLAAAGCGSVSPGTTAAAAASVAIPDKKRVIDAGPSSAYPAEGIYENFRGEGFFITRRERKLAAISSYCTHRHCKLDAEPDHTFSCPCHDSTFDPVGKVTEGPATRDLPEYPLSIDSRGHVIVTI